MARRRFTKLQGQYLAFISSYERVHGVPPSESDIQRHFRVTAPSVHDMVVRLHRAGLISRVPGQARSLRVRVGDAELPQLGGNREPVDRADDLPPLTLLSSASTNASEETDSFDAEFPKSEVVVDCCGTTREFTLDLLVTGGGFFLRATERVSNGEGYLFAAHSESDPYLALGRLRERIKAGLATRYLTRDKREPGLTHGVAEGHLSSDGVVIDGRHITYGQLATMLTTYEGWRFSLKIVDVYEAF